MAENKPIMAYPSTIDKHDESCIMNETHLQYIRQKDLVSWDKFNYNDQGSEQWYRDKYPNFPDYMYPIMRAFSDGIRPKEWKAMLRKEKKRRARAAFAVSHDKITVSFD
jgi:hypothetical protein